MEVKKRDGRLVKYDGSKIIGAVAKAMKEVTGKVDKEVCYKVEEEVLKTLKAGNYPPTVEGIQDSVENTLMSLGNCNEVAKAYILYRAKRNETRKKQWEMNDLQSSIYNSKYRYDNESFDEFLSRVSGGDSKIYKLIQSKKFIPAGRILAGRGLNERGQKVCYSNCFVVTPPEDNLESIFDTAKKMARTYSYGGGCGTSLEHLRPNRAKVNNSAKVTSGAVSFAELYSTTTGLIGQNNRRGALMLSMPVSHPDIVEFIDIKNDLEAVTKANLSVMVSDKFMKAVKEDSEWEMRYEVEDTGEVISKTIKARDLMFIISKSAHRMGEPGMLFWDKVKNYHINSENNAFEYVSTNPCFTGDMQLLTKKGYRTFEELEGQEVELINIDGDTSKGKVWYTGDKETIQLTLSNKKRIKCTPDHRFLTVDNKVVEAKDLKGKKLHPLTEEFNGKDLQYVKYGFIQGDGGLTRLSSDTHKGLEVHIGEDDRDIRELFAKDEHTKPSSRTIYLQGDYIEKLKDLGFSDKTLPEREFPTTYKDWTKEQKSSFLQGMYSANGSVITNHRVSYKTTCLELAHQLLITLEEDFGIKGYITTNKPTKVEFSNGTYLCKQSYDVSISRYESLQRFHKDINFYHNYKKDNLKRLLMVRAPKVTSIKSLGVNPVYDFNEPLTNWGVVEGFIAHNCGEKPLPSGGSCLLGSMNLAEYVLPNGTFDYDNFSKDVKSVTVYMNDVLEEGIKYLPLEEQRESAKKFRQLGIGILGMGDMLIKLGLKYGDKPSLKLMDSIMKEMANSALQQSAIIARDRGTYESFDVNKILKSEYIKTVATKKTIELIKKYGLRNAELLSIAPTGSISTMLGVSGGTEPIFQTSYTRKVESITDENGEPQYFTVYTPIVKEYMEKHGLTNEKELPDYFVTAPELDYKKRIDMQSVLQKYVDSAISSTINLPNETTIEEVADIYMYAWEKGLKGVTVFRDGCERSGILISNETKNKQDNNSELQIAQKELIDFTTNILLEYPEVFTKIQEKRGELGIDNIINKKLKNDPGKCPVCGGKIMHSGGCEECQDCGYSPCSI